MIATVMLCTTPVAALQAFIPIVRSEIDTLAPRALETAGEAGLAVAAIEPGARWVQGYGLRDSASAEAVTDTTIFQVGSISKVLTAWGVMRLVEQRKIELDAPVNLYLKRWTVSGGEFDVAGVTVRRLLTHTAGTNVPSLAGVDLRADVPDLVTELEGRAVRVVRRPGSGFAYSGGGYMILQLLVEDVTGRGFAEYMRAEVLVPLGMAHSFFGWNDTVATNVATPHSPVPERNRRHRLFSGLAGAGLYTTARDLARLLEAHFPGAAGEPRGRGVIAAESLALMLAPDSIAGSYGLGYEIYTLPGGATTAGHSGSNVGWKADLIVVPDLRLGFAVVANADQGRARRAVLEVVRTALARPSRHSKERR